MNNEVSMPVAKAASAIAAAVAAKTDVVDQVALAATKTSSYETWMVINSFPWATVASIAAALYTCLLISEWFWKKLWRPVFENRGWIKPLRHRIITVEEYEADTDRAPL